MREFDPFKETTWKYADPEKILFVCNRKCVNYYDKDYKPVYLHETDLKKKFDVYLSGKTNIKRKYELEKFLYLYISKEDIVIHPEYILEIDGVKISKYINEIIEKFTDDEKHKLASCIKSKGNTSQKELQKELYYAGIKHAYTISRIYFAEKNLDNGELESAFSDYYTRKSIYDRRDYFKILDKSQYLKDNPGSLFLIKMQKNKSK